MTGNSSMSNKGFNWQIWAGAILSIFAFISYPTIFVSWPLTRDFPWANIGLFIVAIPLLTAGMRKAFGPDRGWARKAGAALLGLLAASSLGLFIFTFFVFGTWLPDASGAPRVGQTAPEFTLTDQNGRKVSLRELRTQPIESETGPVETQGVLLIFYRGYW
jgi:hypothetical protein